MIRLWQTAFVLAVLLVMNQPAAVAAEGSSDSQAAAETDSPRSKYRTERIRGKVVWLADAIERHHDIPIDDDVAKSAVALETADGQIIPLLKDARGRGFLMDKRLRNQPMELLVRRYQGLPVVQVITVYTLHDGKKFELDYWCDICAISMYELKVCECCQGPSRLRERKVEEEESAP